MQCNHDALNACPKRRIHHGVDVATTIFATQVGNKTPKCEAHARSSNATSDDKGPKRTPKRHDSKNMTCTIDFERLQDDKTAPARDED